MGRSRLYSSDHAPFRFDASGKLPKGDKTVFKEMANGVPGIEVRMPLLFSEGVHKGRIDIHEFVALTATNHARMYGLAHRKGDVAVGMDADLAVWDPVRQSVITAAGLHDRVGYTPYEGKRITGWPETVVSGGRIVIENGALHAQAGSGQFLPCLRPQPVVDQDLAQQPLNQLATYLGLRRSCDRAAAATDEPELQFEMGELRAAPARTN